MSQGKPIRIAVVNDYEIVVAGVAAALEPYADRVAVVEIDSRLPVASDVDVILYDTFGAAQGASVDVEAVRAGGDARLVVFSWNTHRELVEGALRAGATGYLSKALPAEEIVAAIERIFDGETVLPEHEEPVHEEVGAWPGREHGLTAREAEVLALITQGLSNQEIAQRTYLSINSVKTYIRTAYRKIGVERRSQAVGWGMRHGFEPDRVRSIDDTLG
ncbi:response regulator transcription factor [Nocardioides ferulae]|uniref:response regulator transcription factor n=1 Tax=Nocardioides ferulae TaxID=2340821 RepID=UPI000EB291D4|nr:response regulator transcription factor [Nocardioides ferulae]